MSFGSCAGPNAPLLARMAGYQSDVDLRTMVSPASPVWPLTAGTTSVVGTTMRVYNRWSGTVPGNAGEKVLIQGHVNAGTYLHTAILQPANWPLFGEDVAPDVNEIDARANGAALQTSAMVAKLAIRRARFPGWTLINADSHLVMDPGEIQIMVLGPASAGWYGGATPVVIPAGGEPSPMMFIDVRVSACLLKCCWPPPGRFSTWSLVDPGDDENSRTFVRSRRATALRIGGASIAGAGFRVDVREGQPGGPMGYLTHRITINGGFVNAAIDPLGSFNHFTVEATDALQPVAFDWEIT